MPHLLFRKILMGNREFILFDLIAHNFLEKEVNSFACMYFSHSAVSYLNLYLSPHKLIKMFSMNSLENSFLVYLEFRNRVVLSVETSRTSKF